MGSKSLVCMYVTPILQLQRAQVSVRVQRLCNGRCRWQKATALFWHQHQNVYRVSPELRLKWLLLKRGRTKKEAN